MLNYLLSLMVPTSLKAEIANLSQEIVLLQEQILELQQYNQSVESVWPVIPEETNNVIS